MKHLLCEQKSDEWFACRCGIPSASQFDRIITTEGKPSKQAQKYLYQLAGERILGRAEETYQSAAMQRGTEMEEEARQFYSLVTEHEVETAGFFVAEGPELYGASPDGVIGEDGLLELKCPLLSTHVSYLLDGVLPTEYIQQTQGQLLVTGRAWLDFLSYFPGLPPLLIRVTPDKEFQKALQVELEVFCERLDEVIWKLQR